MADLGDTISLIAKSGKRTSSDLNLQVIILLDTISRLPSQSCLIPVSLSPKAIALPFVSNHESDVIQGHIDTHPSIRLYQVIISSQFLDTLLLSSALVSVGILFTLVSIASRSTS